jgi:hypothetical protein
LHNGIVCQPTAAATSQEQKGQPLNYFIYPYAESDGQPIRGLTTHFVFRDFSPRGLKNSGNRMDQERPGEAQTVRA